MSLEAILKQGAAKRRKKTAQKRRRQNGLFAHDSKYTGEEPIWDSWKEWTVEKFMSERNRALNFYNYYSNSKDMKKHVIDWMTANAYSKEDIRAIKRAPDWATGITVGSLCVSMTRGMPALHPEAQKYHDLMPGVGGTARSDEDFVRERIAEAIKIGKQSTDTISEEGEVVVVKKTQVKISPMQRLIDKTKSTIILDLDVLLDAWMSGKDKVETIAVFDKMKEYGLSAPSSAVVERWLKQHLDELKLALDGTDPDAVEGYSYLSKAGKKNRIEALETMITDLSRFKHSAKAARAPREPKTISASKQIQNLKYLKESPEFKITSINPIRIIGARRLITFSPKYRAIFDFSSDNPAGFAVKGMALKNVDETAARLIRLRKPEEFLTTALNGTEKQFDNAWAKLTTKESKPKLRINDGMVLLRVF